MEGVNQYKVTSQLRKSSKLLDYDVYLVKDTESGDDYRMKVARKDPQILKVRSFGRTGRMYILFSISD